MSSYTNNFFTNVCIYSTNNLITTGDTGNITNNPRFADWVGQNFRLAPDSPCLNTGTNQAWMTNGVNLDGEIRIRYGVVDIGAYELINDSTIYMLH